MRHGAERARALAFFVLGRRSQGKEVWIHSHDLPSNTCTERCHKIDLVPIEEWQRAGRPLAAPVIAMGTRTLDGVLIRPWADDERPEPWEPLDAEGYRFGVFGSEDDSPDPVAIFRHAEDADAWIRWRQADAEDPIGVDTCVMTVDALRGWAWNHLDAPPTACASEVAPGVACGRESEGASYSGSPRCRAHAQSEPV